MKTFLAKLLCRAFPLVVLFLVACGGGGGGGAAPLTPLFAYVANSGDNTVSAYTINGTTGALTQIASSPFAAGTQPTSVTVDPSGKFAYVANAGGNVSAYTINGTTGALTQIASSPFAAGTNPTAVTVDPSGKFAYVANAGDNTVSAYTINATSGALTPVAGSPFVAGGAPYSVTVDSSGVFAYVANSAGNVSAYTITATTGALTLVGSTPVVAGTRPDSVTVDPSGRFAYVANGGLFNPGGGTSGGNVSAYTINARTGALALAGSTPVVAGTNPGSVTVDPSGKFAYVANGGTFNPGSPLGGNVGAYIINARTGTLTPVAGSPFVAGTHPISVTVGKPK